MFAQIWTFVHTRVGIGIAGLSVGAAAFIYACYTAVELFSDPAYLITLYWAIVHAHQHRTGDADVAAFAQLAAVLCGVFGTLAVAVLLAYLGLPLRIKPVPADSGAFSPPSDSKGQST